ncbi:zinc knuckle (CCHC-type) family protein [Striga asiatica]|uniref:Zinc knuckle (CCHC-type) family protein n=1 Tax=Striga asiatica TaxID=4170 RepID=A0A5A7NW48_STRAF|nr:zinc knuckle (CCHC-type) family protein [Striga asiatica]
MRIGDGHTGGGRDSHVSSHVAGFSPQMSGSKPDHPGSGGVPNSGGGRQRVCYNCGKSGHLAASCFEVLGYPDWYPRGGAGRRGGRRGRGGRGGGATLLCLGDRGSSAFGNTRACGAGLLVVRGKARACSIARWERGRSDLGTTISTGWKGWRVVVTGHRCWELVPALSGTRLGTGLRDCVRWALVTSGGGNFRRLFGGN